MSKMIVIHNVSCKHETAKALLVIIEGEEVWVPKSQVSDDSEVWTAADHEEGDLIVTEWWADQNGFDGEEP